MNYYEIYIQMLTKNDGFGIQGILGTILLFTGLGIIYFAVKYKQGYRIMPEVNTVIAKEDNYQPSKAEVKEKIITEMPSFNGGQSTQYIEWKIEYMAEGEVYTQTIPDDNYSKGDILDVKYNPENPLEYYLDNGILIDDNASNNDEDEVPDYNKSFFTMMIILAIFLLGFGGFMVADRLF